MSAMKKVDLPAKNSKDRPFKFQVNINRLSKKSRHIRDSEDSILKSLKIFASLKLSHRGYDCVCVDNKLLYDYLNSYSSIYTGIVDLNTKFCEEFGVEDFKTKFWSSDSSVLMTVYDKMSVSASPDYSIKKEELACKGSTETLYGMFREYMVNKGTLRISEKKYIATCKWLVVFLNQVVKNQCFGIKYTRTSNFKSEHNVCNKDFSIPVCLNLIGMLDEYGLILDYTGNKLFGSKNMSMMIPSRELFEMLQIKGNVSVSTEPKDPVKILDKNDNLVTKENLSEGFTEVYERSVAVITKHKNLLDKHQISFGDFRLPEYWLQRTMRVDVEINSRFFDNGTVQSKTKIVRSYLTIDGESTVSLDFKSIHPCMLLEMEGYSIKNHDPYPTFKDIKVDVKLINKFKSYYNISKYDPVRNIIKRLMLCMINAKSVNEAVGSCYEDLRADSLKKGTFREDTMKYIGLPRVNLHEIAKKLCEHNHMISKYFGVGIGNKLQYKDSAIMLEALDSLTYSDIPCFPVHDALICKESDANVVEDVMAKAFVKVMGDGSEKNCIIERE